MLTDFAPSTPLFSQSTGQVPLICAVASFSHASIFSQRSFQTAIIMSLNPSVQGAALISVGLEDQQSPRPTRGSYPCGTQGQHRGSTDDGPRQDGRDQSQSRISLSRNPVRILSKDLGKDSYTSNGRDIYMYVQSYSTIPFITNELFNSPTGRNATASARPSDAVQRRENENVEAVKAISLGNLSLDSSMPNRPEYATEGEEINLWTNYFEVGLETQKQIFKYSAVIQPEIAGERQRRCFFNALFEETQEFQDLRHGVATDYAKSSIIVTSEKLGLGLGNGKTFIRVYRDPDEPAPRPNARTYRITVTQAGTVPISELLNYVASSPTDPHNFSTAKADALQALNIIVAGHPNKDVGTFQSGQHKSFHYPRDITTLQKYDLSGGLVALRGNYSSVRTSTSRILLNLNAQCSPFYLAIHVYDLMIAFGRTDWQALEKFLEKLRVKTGYMSTPEGARIVRTRTITGLAHKSALDTNGNGTQIRNHTSNLDMKGSATVVPGNANELKFLYKTSSPAELISVNEYFFKRMSNQNALKITYVFHRVQGEIEQAGGVGT